MLNENSVKTQVNIIDGASVYIGQNVKLGENVTIYPNNFIEGDTTIGDNVVLYPNNYIVDSIIGRGASVSFSVVEKSIIESCCKIGPFAHLRPESKIREGAKIGNFVEIKKSEVGRKSKVSHLSYVGDAYVGESVNIGCGVVFVNYNGKTKSKSYVGDRSFIGSSVNLIAPVKVGEGAFVCAGTTVDKDVQCGDFVIGRSRMNIKPQRANRYLKGED